MLMDKVHVVIVQRGIEPSEPIAAYLDEADARGAVRAHEAEPGARAWMEEVPLAPPTSAGIAASEGEGQAEAKACTEALHRTLRLRNMAGGAFSVNQYAAVTQVHFPTWCDIQVTPDNGFRVDTKGPSWAASFDLLRKVTQAATVQARTLMTLLQDVTLRTGQERRIEVVPGLPEGLRR